MRLRKYSLGNPVSERITTLESHLSTPADSTVVATEGDTLAFDHHVLQVLCGLADVHSFDGLGCLTGVLQTSVLLKRCPAPLHVYASS